MKDKPLFKGYATTPEKACQMAETQLGTLRGSCENNFLYTFSKSGPTIFRWISKPEFATAPGLPCILCPGEFIFAACLNFEWAIEHAKVLCDEYTARYKRRHASQDVIEWCDKNSHHLLFDQYDQTEFAVAIAPEMKCRQVKGFDDLDPVSQYRLYYSLDKQHLHSWKRNKREWIEELAAK